MIKIIEEKNYKKEMANIKNKIIKKRDLPIEMKIFNNPPKYEQLQFPFMKDFV